ncbi:VanY-A/VanY-F/VanY-M family D-Ala-D-Ala carboxypeptidase [Radiobacillus kanasensis]|uniref:VanY-A/VanY-F/VanY-M family D-Ala-D-Ala carboxypeptidase n=1 Tax=Radiobacillus kanasensis TaxID=2844358 RepID=UPI001E3E2B82|nr:VanY-A/VanY-F/VanY-M family D-Ala-D-Ala carboxypeptidase [Radiobacillus kanasensis]UFU00179.1 VanY-A/VanY-F/VanY-M family D-Ala-D-Ala carboxypeptidase [Radiobacillus kanasensis]
MKKWGFLILLVLCFGIAYKNVPLSQDNVEIKTYDKKENVETSENTQKIEIKKEQIYEGNLLLVNSDYPVQPQSIKTDVVNLFTHNELINGFVVLNNDIYLSKKIAKEFADMVAAAEKDGVNHFAITSGFRDLSDQQALFQDMGPGIALPPGHSEHNLGLSLDVGSTQMKMAEAPEGEWIENHAWKYGFILRYPENKKDITGIQYEPWHIRYVGLPHSAIMKEKNFVLEEYLDYLKEEKAISANVNGKRYDISYYPVTESTNIHIPVNSHYKISGNNMDGVIVTVWTDQEAKT